MDTQSATDNYLAPSIATALVVIVGIYIRVRMTTKGSVRGQLFGGLNVFVASLLAWMSFVVFAAATNNGRGNPSDFFRTRTIVFVVVATSIWVLVGLVPQTVAAKGRIRLWLGHLLMLAGTMIHGSVTFFIPILIWLKLITENESMVLPWLALFTLPGALILWLVGLTLIWTTRGNLSDFKHR